MSTGTLSDQTIGACLSFYHFSHPFGVSQDIQGCFSSSIKDEESSNFIKNLSESRNVMTQEIQGGSPSASKISAIDHYIPYAFRLMESLNNQETVYLSKPMEFDWRGGFTTSIERVKYREVIYDIIMALHSKAIFHHRMAAEIVLADINNVGQSSQHLRAAAGIMEYINQSLFPRWVSARLRENLPPECMSPVCMAMFHYFNAMAQMLAIIKADQKVGGTPPALMTKLCLAVVKEFDASIDILVRQTADVIKLDIPQLLVHFGALRELSKAIAFKFQAESLLAQAEKGVGPAIWLCGRAQESLRYQGGGGLTLLGSSTPYNPETPGLPRDKGLRVPLTGVTALSEAITAMEKSARMDNDYIYHTVIPTGPADMPELPEAKLLMTPLPFVPPETGAVVEFSHEPPKKASLAESFVAYFVGDVKPKPTGSQHTY